MGRSSIGPLDNLKGNPTDHSSLFKYPFPTGIRTAFSFFEHHVAVRAEFFVGRDARTAWLSMVASESLEQYVCRQRTSLCGNTKILSSDGSRKGWGERVGVS